MANDIGLVNLGKSAIFDLDGTLLDSMGVWDQIDADFLHKRGFEVPQDYMSKVAGMEFRQIAQYTIHRFQLQDTPEALMAEWNDMASQAYRTTVELKPHARDYLRYLKISGAKLAVATSLPRSLRLPAMAHAGIDQYFDVVCGVDDVSGIGKEHPDLYQLVATRLQTTPGRCTVFEDLLAAMKAAQSIGMKVWAMHDDSSDREWPTICDMADGLLFDFSQAPQIL